jgi:hypothetical protein
VTSNAAIGEPHKPVLAWPRMNRVPWTHLIAGLVGGVAGYAYYYYVGCDSG